MSYLHHLLFSLIVMLVAGCVGITLPGDPPGFLGDVAFLDSLVGKKRENVYEKLGLPNEAYLDHDRHYVIYSAKSDADGVVFILYIPFPTGTLHDSAVHCLRLEIDSDNSIKDYEVRSGGLSETTWSDKFPTCKELFWSDKELQRMQRESVVSSIADLSKYTSDKAFEDVTTITDPAKQYKIYLVGVDDKLEWLCRSADLEYLPAMKEVADIFYYGWYSTPINYQLAYSWYHQAFLKGSFTAGSLSGKPRSRLSKKEIAEVMQMKKEWAADQCVKDLLVNKFEHPMD